MTTQTDAIYRKHMQALAALDSTWIDLTTFRYALRLALDECAQAHQPAADIAEEHCDLDGIVRRIEDTVEKRDSELFAALAEGDVSLPTAVERLLNCYEFATKAARAHVEQSAAELDALRQQLAAMDADNAALTQQLHDLRTVPPQPSNGYPTPILTAAEANAQMADLQAEIIHRRETANGKTRTVFEMLAAAAADVQRSNARLEQLNRINDWIRTYAGDAYDPLSDDGDTADAIIAVADRLRGECEQRKIAAGQLQSQNVRITQEFQAVQITINQLRTELAAAINERRVADSLLATLADWLADKPVVGDSNVVDLAISLMTSQAAEIKRLNADLAILRSYSTATPHGNGKSHPAAILPSAQSAQSADETPAWNDAMLTGLDDATADYWHGIAAGRWAWRKLPKSTRLAMVRHVLSFGPEERAMSMSEFDAIKPHWMPGAGSHPGTFGVPWSTLSDMRVEIEVPA